MRRIGLWIVGIGFILGGVACAAEPLSLEQKDMVKALVREALRESPELVLEALQTLEVQQKSEQAQQAIHMVTVHRDALERDPNDPVLGNPQGDVTIVEFFDYRCTYCKQMSGILSKLVKSDGQVRWVFKEYPILGPLSVQAALAALAAQQQGKYFEMHNALMAYRGNLDRKALEKLAQEVKLDGVRFRADMERPDLKQRLQAIMLQGRAVGATGTPTIVIGDHLIPGAVTAEALASALAKARAKKP